MSLNFNQLELNLRNCYFLLTSLITIYYWIKTIFLPNLNSPKFGFFGLIVINLILTSQLISRWIISGHFPLSGLYESLLFLAWSTSFIYIFIEKYIKSEFIGMIVSPFLLCLLTFTEFSLPHELQTTQPLVPALQSNWLFMHVSVMILSYASLLIGSLISIIYLFLNSKIQQQAFMTNSLILLDNLSYRTIGIGFCFLTLGILSGAVWANETWGTYWSWDPKETWALITWLIFAIYLHTRLLYGWTGNKSAVLGSCGFILIWVCYLGVNLLGKGLHTYGFLAS
ncbi:Cytochrome c biogenesis protein CcsA (chloroplast) [Picochlorum sp. SENEW3]|nr:Cytochrome c biogenesis protein CcsA [Picochlorum sp. SENEW3]